MPVDPNAAIEITGFDWVPDFARGFVRDLRPRWACEELGLPYRERLISAMNRPEWYYAEQPFGQVPAVKDGDLHLFESGAILVHLAEREGKLLPTSGQARADVLGWLFASYNSIEPLAMEQGSVLLFHAGEDWAEARKPILFEMIGKKLARLADALGEREWIAGEFSIADIALVSTLREFERSEALARFPTLAAYVERGTARPAYRRAIDAQLAAFSEDPPHSRLRRETMTYIQGFLLPVPTAKKDGYFEMAREAEPFFTEFGATGLVEAWGDDVPDGKQTDMKRAVAAEDGENVVFSWIEYPDKATCDEAARKMESDERMKPPPEMPFDGKRMVYSGFECIMDEGGGPFGYIDGMVAAVPTANRDKYLEHAKAAAGAFQRLGATRPVENWGVDVMNGKVTDFKRAVKAKDDETVVFSWIEWPDKATRDEGMARIMDDPAMQGMEMPFDGSRMIFGGFEPVVITGR